MREVHEMHTILLAPGLQPIPVKALRLQMDMIWEDKT